MSNYNKYNTAQVVKLIKGSVILCIHGFSSSKYAFDSMIETMEKNQLFNDDYACTSLYYNNSRIYLTEVDINNNSFTNNLKKLIKENKNKNIFIPVGFKNDSLGFINNQVSEMNAYVNYIITILQDLNLNIPIILLGHSKGGLVGMNCALKNANVSKIISVGTPYDGTIIDTIFNAIADVILNKFTFNIWEIASDILELFKINHQKLFDEIAQAAISNVVTDATIIEKWSRRNRYIPCTIIGTDAIEFNLGDNNFSGDYVVPLSSSCTSRLKGVTIYKIDSKKITISISNLIKTLGQTKSFTQIKDLLIYYLNGGTIPQDIFQKILNLIFESFKEASLKLDNSLDLAHCSIFGHSKYMLNNTEVCLRIVAGINAN